MLEESINTPVPAQTSQQVIPPTPIIPPQPQQQTAPLPKSPQPSKPPIRFIFLGLGTVLIVFLLATGAYVLNTHSKKTPQPTYQAPSPTPTTAVAAPTSIETLASGTPTPSPMLKTYKDTTFGYSIQYPSDWTFKRTYGPDIPKGAPTDILSGVEITKNTSQSGHIMQIATIVATVLDRHALADTQEWIAKYDLNAPKNATITNILFGGLPAIKYSNFLESDHPTEYIYFLSGDYAYRFQYWESEAISASTRTIVNSFTP